ncbi:MAG: Uma2 family endonuclease [Acidimicrobiales bacterium]
MAVHLSDPARPFTYEDLEDLPEDGYRREIIGGSLIVTPAPNARHQLVVAQLLALLHSAKTATIAVLTAPYDWRLPDGGSVQPDLVVVRRDDVDLDGPLPASARPLLVVEVLSPSNPEQDRAVKKALYEQLGVPAFWLVDPATPSIAVFRLHRGRYQLEVTATGNDVLESDWPFPVRVVPGELLR